MSTAKSNLQNFQILQRNAEGFVDFRYTGKLNRGISEKETIIVRVMRENDNLTVIPWTEAEVTRGEQDTGWSISLRIPEGGLYRVEATQLSIGGSPEWSPKIDCKYHIGVGDIYVMTGQSNMTGYGRDNAYDPPTLGVHSFTRAGVWGIAAHPLCDSIDSPYGYDENGTGTSPALAFARQLSAGLGVPVGLVPAAIGGTSLAQWDPDENGICYERMCAMLKDSGAFKGMLWFQGCSDANPNDCDTYLARFTRIVGIWRKRFGDFPLLTVQLNRWVGNNDGHLDREWGVIRNAQRLAALTIPDVYVVPALDLSVTDGIHDSSEGNVTIGERLANTALKCIYGKVGQCAPTVLSAEKADDTHVRVRITPGYRVCTMDNYGFGMNVEDAEGLIECTQAVPEKDALLVTTARPFGENAVFHYGWRTQQPAFVARDLTGMPLIACYGVEIK